MLCITCKKETKHQPLVKNKSFSQQVHQVCDLCGHSNSYIERSRFGSKTIRQGLKNEKGCFEWVPKGDK